MCSKSNDDNKVRYIFLTQEQYDSINHNDNNINNDEEGKEGESKNE